jgi:tetratricopeptide (TPR) repeat protein
MSSAHGGIAAAWAWYTPASRPVGAETVLSSEAMLRAKFFAQRRHSGDLERAIKEYERALGLAPNLARAWAGIASVHWFEIAEGLQPRDANLPKIRDAAQRALSLDPQLVEAHIRLASYLCATGQRAAAVEHDEKAAAIDQDNRLVLNILAGSPQTKVGGMKQSPFSDERSRLSHSRTWRSPCRRSSPGAKSVLVCSASKARRAALRSPRRIS